MRHRSRRPLLDTFARPRLAAGLAVLCAGAAATAALVAASADPHTASAHGDVTVATPVATDPVIPTQRPASRSGDRHAKTAPSVTATASPAPSRTPSTPAPVRTHSPSLLARVTASATRATPTLPTPSTPAASTPTPSTPAASTPAASTPTLGTPTAAPADTVAPDTGISTLSTTGSSALFRITADGPASFQCSLDGAPYAACSPDLSLTGLGPGWHTLSARAVDAAGNVDATPASTRWHVAGADLR
jgi:hypothetical protein